MESGLNIIEMEGISKSFAGVRALDHVFFSLRRGEVMGLLGENGAGKSTLMKILLGIYTPDSGNIRFKGKAYKPTSPHDALQSGISMIHQEISLIPTMSVAENIWFGREKHFKKLGLIDTGKRNKAALELLSDLGIHSISPSQLVSDLSIANMQLVEIARAVSYEADVIIMDEPTSSLTEAETEILFRIIEKVKKDGASIIFISHKLDEVIRTCDRATVFRDGQYIDTVEMSSAQIPQLIKMIAGRDIKEIYPEICEHSGEVALAVEHLEKKGVFHDVSFEVRRGEILGFCGLVGAGRTEIMSCIFGLDHPDGGTVFIKGKPVRIRKVHDAIRNGIAMVNEDRPRMGILPQLSVRINISIAYLHQICKASFISFGAEKKDFQKMVELLGVKCGSDNQEIASLSGGNQQKCILGRWLLTKPDILILDEPTRGIDVGAKSEIYRLIKQLASQGIAVIFVSSELPELMGMSHRIIVVRNGKVASEFKRSDFSQEAIMQSAFGAADEVEEEKPE